MQAYGDIFLSRTRDPAPDTVDRHFYIRQLRDWNSWCRSRRCSRRLRGGVDRRRHVRARMQSVLKTAARRIRRNHFN
jgi:hypothetical protein